MNYISSWLTLLPKQTYLTYLLRDYQFIYLMCNTWAVIKILSSDGIVALPYNKSKFYHDKSWSFKIIDMMIELLTITIFIKDFERPMFQLKGWKNKLGLFVKFIGIIIFLSLHTQCIQTPIPLYLLHIENSLFWYCSYFDIPKWEFIVYIYSYVFSIQSIITILCSSYILYTNNSKKG